VSSEILELTHISSVIQPLVSEPGPGAS
jgi:hypothetical protein